MAFEAKFNFDFVEVEVWLRARAIMRVQHLADCRLVVSERRWSFEQDRAEAIEEHWTKASGQNPKLFDGEVFVVERWSIEDSVLQGVSMRTRFAAYLYWRDTAFAETACSEAFATSVIVADDGGVLLARAVSGTLNQGLYASPGGLLDARDMDERSRLDLAGAAAREVLEETGLDCSTMRREPGYLLADVQPYLAVASVYRSSLSGEQLLGCVEAFLDQVEEPELEAPCIVANADELVGMSLTPFARLLTAAVMA